MRYLQDRHAGDEPEILLTSNVDTAQVPCPCVCIPDVTQNGESPCEDDARPTDETVMALENTKKKQLVKTRDACGIFLTHLWCVFLTHGNALMALIATAKFVHTPTTRMESLNCACFLYVSTTFRVNHASPERAQPLWIPPRCCTERAF